eukprot:CAMPEP_0173269760 /NCGR_PEP_ID=MMETSP1142-20121109/31049_1 /TAXON_ID=483371 /ORGANISM="non described non described, Strain CCMP2298" /LENGTH=108 /DNA_ID=CAMNT_0014206125 /DNA_START=82 /DNA_END=405 /DNA_ORIENTATION=+
MTTPTVLNPKEDDMHKMLACQVHLGTKNLDHQMAHYVWKRRADGIYVINLAKTWDKLMLAARIIVAVENPADVVVITGYLHEPDPDPHLHRAARARRDGPAHGPPADP